MTKLQIFFAIAIVFIGGAFWVNMQGQLAQENCIMSGGKWSASDKSCDK